MNFKHFFFVFSLITGEKAFTQQQDTVAVPLFTVIADSSIFGRRTMGTSASDQSIRLKNIPSDIVDYRIRTRTIDISLPNLHILYGRRADRKRIVIFDSNFDNDLTGETIYVFGSDNSCQEEVYKKVRDSIAPVKIKYPGLSSFFFKPSIYVCGYNYKTADDSTWHLNLDLSYFRKGHFDVSKKHLTIVSNVYNRLPQFYIDKGDTTLARDIYATPPQRLNEPFYIDGEEFEVYKISPYFDTAWVISKGLTDISSGIQTGLFAKNINGFTMNGQPFSLSSLRGNFVLLDFWGSWCGPCIKLIPDLVKLNRQYSGKLKVVSIAYDRKENISRLNQLIKDKQMRWTHLFADQTQTNNVCEQYNISVYPTSILIDPDGKIVERSAGAGNFSELRKIIASCINKSK
ncbi:MAG: TlpA family protein disulfide reductase [Chitinophagaceae bacterium]|nr:TlpA family protein disulfide reductase [Chitinophagaceae bacterium]